MKDADRSIDHLLCCAGYFHFRDPKSSNDYRHVIVDAFTGDVVGRMDAKGAVELLRRDGVVL